MPNFRRVFYYLCFSYEMAVFAKAAVLVWAWCVTAVVTAPQEVRQHPLLICTKGELCSGILFVLCEAASAADIHGTFCAQYLESFSSQKGGQRGSRKVKHVLVMAKHWHADPCQRLMPTLGMIVSSLCPTRAWQWVVSHNFPENLSPVNAVRYSEILIAELCRIETKHGGLLSKCFCVVAGSFTLNIAAFTNGTIQKHRFLVSQHLLHSRDLVHLPIPAYCPYRSPGRPTTHIWWTSDERGAFLDRT